MVPVQHTVAGSPRPAGHGLHATSGWSALAFFILVCVLTLPFLALQAVTAVQLLPGLPVSSLAVVTPVAAAAILESRSHGLAGIGRLLRRSIDFNRVARPIWYLPAIGIPPAVAILSFLVLRLAGVSVPFPEPLSPTTIVLFLVLIVAALAEELGWMGYAYGPLEGRFGTIGASVVLGVVWAAWHYVPLAQVGRDFGYIAWWTLGTVAMRVIMVWLFKNTGESVFMVALFHAMSNLVWQLFPIQGSYFDPRVNGLLMAATAMVILVAWGPSLVRRRRWKADPSQPGLSS